MIQQHTRDPSSLSVYTVCPICKEETTISIVVCDGHNFPVHYCIHHGDVVPVRSHVANARTAPSSGSEGGCHG